MDDPKLIAALVGLIVELTLLVKVYRDLIKVKADRTETKVNRDKDSLELHDKILKHDFLIAQLKDQQSLTATVVDDLRDQCAALNTNIVKLDTNVANLTEAIRDLKETR
jgi:peptidoglycan hydrolase CwlO-like protein